MRYPTGVGLGPGGAGVKPAKPGTSSVHYDFVDYIQSLFNSGIKYPDITWHLNYDIACHRKHIGNDGSISMVILHEVQFELFVYCKPAVDMRRRK